jgi:aryl-phospho-beta-D-glucosidase BglC (GH1 family)
VIHFRTIAAVLSLAAAIVSLQAADFPRVKHGDEVKDGRPSVRWRGFNLVNMLVMGEKDRNPSPFKEDDFRIIRDWGFNFVRLPMDYRFWIKGGERKNWETFDERHLTYVDRAVKLGIKYGIHVSLNMHRCPGHTVASPKEPTDLFSDDETLRVCCAHWAMFAKRYKGIPSEALSFNLFNEPPPRVPDEKYGRVIKALVSAIRAEDPTRFIIADGANTASVPVWSAAGIEGVGQATRGYAPTRVTHYYTMARNIFINKGIRCD